MEDFFLEVVNLSVTASWVIAVVLLLRLLLRPVPKKYVCLLWLVVLFRLLCPVTLESQFSLVPQHQTIQPEIVYTTPQVQTAAANFSAQSPGQRQSAASVFVSGGAAVGAGDGGIMRLHFNKLAAAAAAATGGRARWRGYLSV